MEPFAQGPAGAVDAPVPILIVDDRRQDARMLADLLAGPGYELIVAGSGGEALKRVLERDFAAILLDVMMPMMDGFEVAAFIKQRERSRHTPIIFLTAAGDDVSAIYRAYSIGAVDYLSKPLNEAIVRAKVAIFADLHRKDRRLREQAEALREAAARERDLHMAELRLLSEKQYRSLLEMIPAAVWTASAAGEIAYSNHQWRSTTGLTRAQTEESGWLSIVHPDDARRALLEWTGALARQGDYVTELRLRMRGGTYRWHLCHVMADRPPDGPLRGWVGMLADCQELRSAIEGRDEFISVASHELRTPLTTLMLQLESLQSMLPTVDAKNARRLTGALRQAQRLEKLVGSLLDVSRIGTGRLQLDPEPVDLAELARSCVERFSEEAARAGSPIELAVETGEPDAFVGQWDRSRIEQVLTNLLSNAVKYGAGRPIAMAVASDAHHVRVRVADHGIGIGLEDQARIFGRFERAVPTRNYGGLGLGLFISKEIVEAHGGSIRLVQSEPAAGAVFEVSLPFAPHGRTDNQKTGPGGGTPVGRAE